MAKAGVRWTAIVVALSVGLTGCGGGGSASDVGASASASQAPATTVDVPALLQDGVISPAALAATTDANGEPRPEALAALVAEFLALPPDQQDIALSDLALRLELASADAFGLTTAVGDEASTTAALSGAYTKVQRKLDADRSALEELVASAPDAGSATTSAGRGSSIGRSFHATPIVSADDGSGPSGGAVAGLGLFLGYIAVATAGSTMVDGSNSWEAGRSETLPPGDGMQGTVSTDAVSMQLAYTGKQDGVDVQFKATVSVKPCPAADGTFEFDATIDVKASKGGAGQNAKVDVKVNGQVDDNADIASTTYDSRTEWSDFANGKGQYVDFTMGGANGTDVAFNRSGGAVTTEFVQLAVMMSAIIGGLIKAQLLSAAERAWKSGRCVALKVTPSAGPAGLDPSAVVSVLAEPRSKVDGSPTGGTVTGTLSNGGQSFEPDGSAVPADANSTYTAPDEVDKSGTVDFEARSKRGVGKASVTFTTSKATAYKVVGGLQDWKVSMVVCDVTKPFTLESPGVGTANFSGGLSGTYEASGVFNFHYAGTYTITLENGLGSPGKMIATSGGTIAGKAGSGSEKYVLTPATC